MMYVVEVREVATDFLVAENFFQCYENAQLEAARWEYSDDDDYLVEISIADPTDYDCIDESEDCELTAYNFDNTHNK